MSGQHGPTRAVRAALGAILLGGGAIGCQATGGEPRPLFGDWSAKNAVPDGPPVPLLAGSRDASGVHTPHIHPAFKAPPADDAHLPKELNKVTMPPYMVEAPDILLIDAQRLIPLPPYRVEVLDQLYIRDLKTLARDEKDSLGDEINGIYPVQPDGTIDLGPNYGGPLRVTDLTVLEVEQLLTQKLREVVRDAAPTVSLAQARGAQQIRGEHLVNPDGTVSLGLYGSVYIAGMTIPQVKQAIESHLSRFLYKPEVSVQVSAYNSKHYYVITDFAGSGEQVVRLPSTGNETVLDAVSNIGGLSAVSSKRVWVARPAPSGVGDQILPVDWLGITRRGTTRTNYQVLPGDRVFVMGQPLTKLDTALARTLAPVERVFGTALFGATAIQTIQGRGIFGNNVGGTTVIAAP